MVLGLYMKMSYLMEVGQLLELSLHVKRRKPYEGGSSGVGGQLVKQGLLVEVDLISADD